MALFSKATIPPPVAPASAAVAEKPRLPTAPKTLTPFLDREVMDEAALAEYREVAAAVGVSDQDLLVEEFRLFLAKHDLPTFRLAEVVSYMDEIAARDNPTGFGWHWCPVRPKDAEVALTFGRPSHQEQAFRSTPGSVTPASDFYESHRFQNWHRRGLGGVAMISFSQDGTTGFSHPSSPPSPPDWRTMPSPAYTRTLPLHALKKIALIEKHFGAGKAVFLVTDYATAPHIVVNPDPFLMAVVPNSAVAHGKGRFIIDVWDEPGFGIERMVK